MAPFPNSSPLSLTPHRIRGSGAAWAASALTQVNNMAAIILRIIDLCVVEWLSERLQAAPHRAADLMQHKG